jgi:aryl-alcohol dehydrogenase-like predicted oxidoreductase
MSRVPAVDLCLEAGVNLFDTANCYSDGLSEEILGEVLEGRREDLLLATKARMVVGPGPNDGGVSRYHLIRECEKSLRRELAAVIVPLLAPGEDGKRTAQCRRSFIAWFLYLSAEV